MSTLTELKNVNGKIYKCKIFDPNYDELFHHKAIYCTHPFKTVIFVSENRFRLEITGFETNVLFSINLEDLVCAIQNKLSIRINSMNLYSVYENGDFISDWIIANKSYILNLNLAKSEALVVYRNAIVLYCSVLNSVDDRIFPLFNLITNIRVETSGDKLNGFDFANVPSVLYPLLPFIEKWAISDDLTRTSAFSTAKRKDQNELLKIGVPLLNEVDKYLNQQNVPLPNEAVLLSRLAETISETLKLKRS
jgi:hypothetical protein